VLALGVGTGLLLFAHWLLQPTTLPIHAVRVEGSFQHLTPADVRAQLVDKASGGFFSLDVDRVKQAAESLPWVAQASVRRVWPDTLVVIVQEQTAVAHWNKEDLLNTHGQIFRPHQSSSLPQLPRLGGPEGSASVVLDRYQNLSTLLNGLDLQIAELSLSERRAWELQLANGTRIQLGREQDDMAVQRLVQAYPVALREQLDRIAEIDLRYTNGFAVRWRAAAEKTS
jgi:cell division protein FtsQ